jgi:hypothetical protein
MHIETYLISAILINVIFINLCLMFGFILKHFIADFLLQGPYQFLNKGKYLHPGGILHAGIAVLASAVVFAILMLMFGTTLFPIVLLGELLLLEFIIHYNVDWAKMNINQYFNLKPDNSAKYWWLLGFDQCLHYLTYLFMIWQLDIAMLSIIFHPV